jgi:hypothetical protein
MLSVAVTTCYEPVSKGVVVFFQLIVMYDVFGRENTAEFVRKLVVSSAVTLVA